MGCGGSTDSRRGSRKGSIFHRQPKVSIRIGNAVKVLDDNPKIIFVFGGPGTKKGRILEDVCNVFGFELVNMENIMMEEFAKKLENPDPNNITPEIQRLIKAEPELLRLDWTIKQLVKKLSTMDKNKTYLVDFMPNFKFLLNAATFVKECSNEFRVFQESFPISFAIQFILPLEKLKKQVEAETHKVPTPTDKPGAQSDEADSTKTQKRAAIHNNSIKPFLDYFTKQEKLVTVDVSCRVQDIIWAKVCEFFTDMEMECGGPNTFVIFFAFSDDDLDKLEVGRYEMQVISLQDIVEDPMADVEKLIQGLCKYLDKGDPTKRAFAVNLTDTALTKDCQKKRDKKSIIFVDPLENCKLDKYCDPLMSSKSKSKPVLLQAVSSVENEVCLFHNDLSSELCKWVASMMRTCRE